jgi:hypothetical protein
MPAFAATAAAFVDGQPTGAPAVAPPLQPFASHPYKSALVAVGGYTACARRPQAADAHALEAELRAIEALAVARGLGPTLERLRHEYLMMLAISSRTCVPGTPETLASARRALADFRAWVEDQPAR